MLPPAETQPVELLTSLARLRKIDLLRDKNIGTYLPLPQLVAVGDQSSGKSSVLESLTGIPFPRGQELCTRYATQITHRRERDTFINVSIIPAPSAAPEEKARLEAFCKLVSTSLELQKQLPSILEEVNKLLGIRTTQNPEGTKTFTEDVLKIEKCGPDEDYLTIIDVPGIFRITTDNVTTEADKTMVRAMVENYIRDDQTIILAVLPCNVDIVTQEILALAEKYDPIGQRTLGILTKPDLVLERSAKAVVCSLVTGEKKALNLGYHIVRNRGGDDDDDATFGDAERDVLFKQDPWCHLPSDRLGVVALRHRLQHLLGDLTDKAFPKLRSKIRLLHSQAQNDLAQLGESRQTEKEQQQYLSSIASEFQALVRAALNTEYSSSSIFDNEDFRLTTNIINAIEDFAKEFNAKAHRYQFIDDNASDVKHERLTDNKNNVPVDMNQFPDLDTVIIRHCDVEDPKQGIMEWIKRVHRSSRGSELTGFNSTLFASVVRQQTSKWSDMTEHFVSKIVYMIHQFIVNSLKLSCSDKTVRDELLSQILDTMIDRYKKGMELARALVGVERMGHPYTLNTVFRETLSRLSISRKREDLEDKVERLSFADDNRIVIALEDIEASLTDRDSSECIAEDLHDMIKSYYAVARDRFIDNLYLQIINEGLIHGKNSPLRLFTEQWVLELDPDKLEAIAGESFQTREQRDRLTKRIRDLGDAIDILR